MIIKAWIVGRLCEVHGFIEEDRSVGIWPFYVVDHILLVEGVPFTAEELERLHEDFDLASCISDSAMEVCKQVERLAIPDYEFQSEW